MVAGASSRKELSQPTNPPARILVPKIFETLTSPKACDRLIVPKLSPTKPPTATEPPPPRPKSPSTIGESSASTKTLATLSFGESSASTKTLATLSFITPPLEPTRPPTPPACPRTSPSTQTFSIKPKFEPARIPAELPNIEALLRRKFRTVPVHQMVSNIPP